MPDEMLLDAPVDITEPSGDQTGIEESPDDGLSNQDDSHRPDESQRSQDDGRAILDGKRLSPDAQASIEEIKAKNPALARQMRAALFEADALRKAFPGGVREMNSFRQQVEEFGGRDAYERVQDELGYFNNLDQQFTSGNPKFIDAMTETPEGQEAFVKLGPAVFEKYAELHPEGFNQYITSVIFQDMLQKNIPLALQRLGDHIADNPKAQEEWSKIAEYYNFINKKAQGAVAAPKFTQRTNNRESELDQRETEMRRGEWRTGAVSEIDKIYGRALQQAANGRKLTTDQAQTVRELVMSRVMRRASSNNDHNSKISRYFEQNNRSGYMRYISSFYSAELPRALSAVIASIVPQKAAVAAKNGGGAVSMNKVQNGGPNQGFTLVSGIPRKDLISRQTTPDMIRAGRAILTDGKKVYWRR